MNRYKRFVARDSITESVGKFSDDLGNGVDEYIPNNEGYIKPTTLFKIIAALAGLGFFAYIYNKNFLQKKNVSKKMGEGRKFNNYRVKPKTTTTILTDTVVHEDGVPQIKEDEKVINVIPKEKRILETEYNAGINEDVPKRPGRKFNFIYPGLDETPLFDTIDYLNDLQLSYKDKSGSREPGNKHTESIMTIYENFMSQVILPPGYEIVPSDD
jgi:hypothetical protein